MLGDGTRKFAARWDRRDDYVEADFGVVGEDADGVWCTVHPDALGVEYSQRCGEALSLYQLGMQAGLQDVSTLSESTIQGLAILRCAGERDALRRAKERANDGQ